MSMSAARTPACARKERGRDSEQTHLQELCALTYSMWASQPLLSPLPRRRAGDTAVGSPSAVTHFGAFSILLPAPAVIPCCCLITAPRSTSAFPTQPLFFLGPSSVDRRRPVLVLLRSDVAPYIRLWEHLFSKPDRYLSGETVNTAPSCPSQLLQAPSLKVQVLYGLGTFWCCRRWRRRRRIHRGGAGRSALLRRGF